MKTVNDEQWVAGPRLGLQCSEQPAGCLPRHWKVIVEWDDLDLKTYKIRELIANGDVVMQYCITQRQVADILTKLLPPQQFRILSDRLCGYWVLWEDGIPPS